MPLLLNGTKHFAIILTAMLRGCMPYDQMGWSCSVIVTRVHHHLIRQLVLMPSAARFQAYTPSRTRRCLAHDLKMPVLRYPDRQASLVRLATLDSLVQNLGHAQILRTLKELVSTTGSPWPSTAHGASGIPFDLGGSRCVHCAWRVRISRLKGSG